MKKVFFALFALSLCTLFFLFPERITEFCREGLALCARSLIPSLFPFMVLSNFLVKSGALPPSPRILGIVGGYPLGAQIVCDLHRSGQISKEEAARLLPSVSFCGIGFFLGALPSVFGSLLTPLLLWGIHLISALPALLLAPKLKLKPSSNAPLSSSFTEGVKAALFSCLNICAFVVFFSVICGFFPDFLAGLFEMSRGVFSNYRGEFYPILLSFYLGFGGFCVQAQVISLCIEAGISPRRHFLFKLLQGVLAAVLTFFVK